MSKTTHRRGEHDDGEKTVRELSRTMRKQDIAMLSTRHGDDIAARPMSNNRDVDWDGDTFFYTTADTTTVADIKADPHVGVSYQDDEDGIYIALNGRAELHTDRESLAAHWQDKLEQWFEGGLDTNGLTLVQVHAHRAHYWIKGEEGELVLED